jgi:hypothetical protein
MTLENNLQGQQPHSYIEWRTIAAGTVLAIAISLVLTQFGTAVGIADLDGMLSATPTPLRLLLGGVYVLVIQLLASSCGGYVAGRMRAPILGSPMSEREIRDGVHGLLVWATGTVLVGIALFIGAVCAKALGSDANEVELTKEVIQQRHTISVILAFSAGATSLVSAVVAWFAATRGGDHRDNMTDHSHHISFRK